MTSPRLALLVTAALAACSDPTPSARARSADPLPGWTDGAHKAAIINFVERVTRRGSPDFVPPAQRIAVLDNDGTLWPEQPVYTQVAFALDRVKALAPQHPAWRTEEPFASVLRGDPRALADNRERGLELLAATHSGMTSDAFAQIVSDWIATARHPLLHRRYTELAYAPMRELLAYLRAHGFTPYIVSGGGAEFMRPWTERVYGIPPEHVIGSRGKLAYQIIDGAPALMRLPAVDFIDDKEGKPIGIEQAIGRRPILAVGNSDGDFEMLDWTTSAPGPRLGVLIHHTDAAREWAYDRDAKVGRLARALDAAPSHGWVVVDMARDWRVVFAGAIGG